MCGLYWKNKKRLKIKNVTLPLAFRTKKNCQGYEKPDLSNSAAMRVLGGWQLVSTTVDKMVELCKYVHQL